MKNSVLNEMWEKPSPMLEWGGEINFLIMIFAKNANLRTEICSHCIRKYILWVI